MKRDTLMQVIKIGVSVATVGLTLAQGYFKDKELDSKVAKSVEEALKNKAGES